VPVSRTRLRSARNLPGFASSELGKIILQFKAFALSSVNRLVIPLAQGMAHGDVKAANGLASMLALGGLTYTLKELAAGRQPDFSPHNLIPEAVQRSGILTFLPDLYDPMAGALHLPRFSKFQDLDPLETLGGPTAGTLAALLGTIKGMTDGEVSVGDLHKLRQLLPYQNLFYFRRLIDMLDGKTADAISAGSTQRVCRPLTTSSRRSSTYRKNIPTRSTCLASTPYRITSNA
jgi:hypothetical protein